MRFGQGSEVNNDEPWQFYLDKLIHHDVKNFGVSGYGIDQAYLKLKSHYDIGSVAPITMLVVYDNDLKRALNNYRELVNLTGPTKLTFKPSYRLIDGQVRFFPMPEVDSSMTLDDLRAMAMGFSTNDYLMTNQRLYFAPEFHYSCQVIKAPPKIANKAYPKIRGVPFDTSIWNTQEGYLVANHIIDQFNQAAKQIGSISIVMFIPDVSKWKDGRKMPPYHAIRAHLENKNGNGPLVLDIADAEFDESRFSIMPFKGHPSRYGNQAIASHIAGKLKEWHLVY